MKYIVTIVAILFSFTTLAWQEELKKEISKIDKGFEGEIGVVIKDLKNGSLLEYNADKKWYLSSTMKVFIATSLMEEVDNGKIDLNKKIKLEKKNFVDGAGPVIWSQPGTEFTVSFLLQAMLEDSDNTAADMLYHLVGKEEINRDFKKWMPDGKKATSLLDVRYLAYKELHPKANTLSNMDFINFKNAPIHERHLHFAKKIEVPLEKLNASNLEEAHEKFYSHQYNSASLQSYVTHLEKLSKGELLSKRSTDLILNHMSQMKTGENRLKAGLGADTLFYQKTGTQIHRACNVGLIRKKSEEKYRIALAVCINKPSENINSDEVFKKIGQKVEASSLI